MDIVKYKKEAEGFLSKIEKEYYLHFSGQKDSFNISDIYDRYDHLFTKKNIDYIRNLKDRSTGEERKKAAYLLKFCTEGYIGRQTKKLTRRIAEDEARANVVIEGKKVPFRYSEILLANERDKAKRDEIEDKRNMVVAESFNDTLREYWSTLHRQAADLGFSSYRELFSYLKEEDFFNLQIEMERLLNETQDLYEEHFGNLLKSEMNIRLSDSRKSDFAFIKRAKKFDKFFKKDSLIPIFKDTLSEMGIDMHKYNNIHLDVEERKNKSPRAFCCVPKVPTEIYLVVMPSGGQDDYETVLHEGGHSLHFGSTGSKLDFEYRCLGDNAVTEGYAFCMEQLMQNREWLVDFFKMSYEQAREFVYFSNLVKLWFCRRYAGKLRYELILHDGQPLNGKDSVYKEILSTVNLMEYTRENYLKDVDDGFYCTNYIRAWIFQSQLKKYMYRKFDYRWYKKKEAGLFLRELWSYGQKYSVPEILSQLGFEKMDIDYLITSLIDEIRSF
ncbi:MAG: hypothetical protein A2163_06360 [Actinobacteria bacterium RBG_13_35_12]|nr:MAG: hypothetical protein A2163_06360 [Actinobacteria bacterium RBG_13_35_12]